MDLVKEIRELVAAVRSALADGKITPAEALRIAKELTDVLVILLEIVAMRATPAENQENK